MTMHCEKCETSTVRLWECLNNERRYDSKFRCYASWRWPIFKLSVVLPPIFSIVECMLNKVKLRYRHVVMVATFGCLYVALNWAANIFLSKSELYPHLTVWDMEKESIPDFPEGHNKWTDRWRFFTILILGSIGFSFIFTKVHKLKEPEPPANSSASCFSEKDSDFKRSEGLKDKDD